MKMEKRELKRGGAAETQYGVISGQGTRHWTREAVEHAQSVDKG